MEKKASKMDFCSSKHCKSRKCEDEYKCKSVSPEAWAEPEEEEEAIALSEAGQEGEHQVDAQDVDQTLPPPHLVTQTPPHQRSHQHGNVYQQTWKCTHINTDSVGVQLCVSVLLWTQTHSTLKGIMMVSIENRRVYDSWSPPGVSLYPFMNTGRKNPSHFLL